MNRKEWPQFLLARGRAKEAQAAAAALSRHPLPLVRALSDILASRALAALRLPAEAADAGNRALKQMKAAGTIGGVLVPDFQLAQGEHLLRSGQVEQGRVLLRDAGAKLRAQSGPDAWIQSLFALEGIARLAREHNDWILAADMTEAMRQHDPAYAGTFYAQALLADHRGARDEAHAGYGEAVRRWQAADADFSELTEARRRLER